jgi:phosphoribosylformylglycinamidine synthase
VTDGLNFGNPTYPEVYWQFAEAVEGIASASEALETPVISGNVSFYNESELGEISPTPMIGMVGVLDDPTKSLGLVPRLGDTLALISTGQTVSSHQGLGASAFLVDVVGTEDGYPEAPDLAGEKRLCAVLAKLASQEAIASAHDVSDGGIAVALAEMAIAAGLGINASLPTIGLEVSQLFGEFQGNVVVSTDNLAKVREIAESQNLLVIELGEVTSEPHLNLSGGFGDLNWTLLELEDAYENAIPRIMGAYELA